MTVTEAQRHLTARGNQLHEPASLVTTFLHRKHATTIQLKSKQGPLTMEQVLAHDLGDWQRGQPEPGTPTNTIPAWSSAEAVCSSSTIHYFARFSDQEPDDVDVFHMPIPSVVAIHFGARHPSSQTDMTSGAVSPIVQPSKQAAHPNLPASGASMLEYACRSTQTSPCREAQHPGNLQQLAKVMESSEEFRQRVQITAQGCEALSTLLSSNDRVKTVLLPHNVIGDKGLWALSSGLRRNTSLVTLDLSHNAITNAGIGGLASALADHPSLQNLLLSHNSIGDAGAVHIAKLICQNRCLDSIDLTYNMIGSPGCDAIRDAALSQRTLRRLQLLPDWRYVHSWLYASIVMSEGRSVCAAQQLSQALRTWQDLSE